MSYFSHEQMGGWPVQLTVSEWRPEFENLEDVQRRVIFFMLARLLRPDGETKPLAFTEVLASKQKFSLRQLIAAIENLREQWRRHAEFFAAAAAEYQLDEHPIRLPPAGESGQFMRLSFETADEVIQDLVPVLNKLA
jgi:hypothetical protein